MSKDICFQPLFNYSEEQLPDKFPYPFYYQPDEIAVVAAEQLMKFLENFGVLEIKNETITVGTVINTYEKIIL